MSLVQAASVKRQLKLGPEDHLDGKTAGPEYPVKRQVELGPEDNHDGSAGSQDPVKRQIKLVSKDHRAQPEARPEVQSETQPKAQPKAQPAGLKEPELWELWDEAEAWQVALRHRTSLLIASGLVASFAFVACVGLFVYKLVPRKGRKCPHGDKLEQAELNSYLCPDLVVPADSECTLSVPLGGPEQESLKVTDTKAGTEVLDVVFRMLQPVDKRIGEVLLTTSTGEVLALCGRLSECHFLGGGGGLAQCCRISECQFLRGDGDFFGTLARNGNEERYSLRIRDNEEMDFTVSSQPLEVRMTDGRGRLLALFDMPKGACAGTLRVAPMMDVSIALCAVLAINYLA